MLIPAVSAAPVANFTASPTTGLVPLTVQFTDISMGNPIGWAWYFGDENYNAAWMQMTPDANWSARWGQNCAVMPDGSIILMGGSESSEGTSLKNDVWRSTDNGATWTEMTADAGWSPRCLQGSVVMADGSIVLMGGSDSKSALNDVWRSTDNGVTWNMMNASAGWSPRWAFGSVAMPDGSIIIMGGQLGNGVDDLNDVWRSTDNGATWTRMTSNAGWSPRWAFGSVGMPDGSIVVTGGQLTENGKYLNDVWMSTDNGATWKEMTAKAGWGIRASHSSVVMPDGSIMLMGGENNNDVYHDVWRSTDDGATWTLTTSNAGWAARSSQSGVVMADGSIVVLAGSSTANNGNGANDVWRLETAGSSAQDPSHSYAVPGIYPVALQAYNWAGYSSVLETGYITVTDTGSISVTSSANGAQIYLDGSSTGKATPGTLAAIPVGQHQLVLKLAGYEDFSKSLAVTGGQTTTIDAILTPATPVNANFTATPTSGEVPFNVRFTDVSTGNPTGWAWYFGDENYNSPWTQMISPPTWTGRYGLSSVTLADGSIVLMGGYDGSDRNDVWRSTNGGVAWTQMTANAGWTPRVRHTSVLTADGSIIVMGGQDTNGNSLNDTWRSTDDGATWTEMAANAGWTARYGQSSVVMPDGSIVTMAGFSGSSTNDVWRSTDNGVTWTEMNADAGFSPRNGQSSVAMADGSIVMLGGINDSTYLNDVWRSTDNGATWTGMNASAGWTARYGQSSLAMPDGSIVMTGGYVSTGNTRNDVWRSTDNGATWTEMASDAEWETRSLHSSVAMPDGSIVVLGGVHHTVGSPFEPAGLTKFENDVWRSTDNGATWTETTITNAGLWTARYGHTSVAMPDGCIVLMGGSGTNGGNTFYNDVWLSPDKGRSWLEMNASAPWSGRWGHTSVVMPDGSIVLMGGSYGSNGANLLNDVWRSTDNGTTWTEMTANAGWSGRYEFSSVGLPDGSIVVMGGYDSKIGGPDNDVWRSTDSGATWTELTSKADWLGRQGMSSVVMPDGSIVVMGGFEGQMLPQGSTLVRGDIPNEYGNDVWRSTDEGSTWKKMTGNAGWSGRSSQCSVAMPDSSIILMGGYDGGYDGNPGDHPLNDVWKSNDDGATWSELTAAGWTARYGHASVVMPDGSIVVMGGENNAAVMNDVWQMTTAGSSDQNPSHTYTTAGTYPVALQAYNSLGYNRIGVPGYITAGTTGSISVNSTLNGALVQIDGNSTGLTTPFTIAGIPAGSHVVVLKLDGYEDFTVNVTVIPGQVTKVNAILKQKSIFADFSVTPTNGTAPLTVKITDKSIGKPGMLVYNFGDGTNATGPNPVHTYKFPGAYSITLSIMKYNATTNSIVSSVTKKTDAVIVTGVPVVPLAAKFAASPVNGTAPLNVTFVDQSTGSPTFLNYDFGDGINATSRNPVHTYKFPGTYNVTLTILKNDIINGSIVSNVSVQRDLIRVNVT